MIKLRFVTVFVALAALSGCQTTPTTSTGARPAPAAENLDAIKTIVVLYAENRSFDNLYGSFPGANGVANAGNAAAQRDRDGSVLKEMAPASGEGMTESSDPKEITTEMTKGHPNRPYALDDPNGYGVTLDYKLHDLIHAFYQNQMQIHGGKNDMFAAYSNVGGQVMGFFDGSKMALWKVAQKYTLADDFFQGGFGSSFFNHQYLICACAAFDFKTAADPETFRSNVSEVNDAGTALRMAPRSPKSALDGPPKFAHYGVLTNDYYAVNTIQPPYQPSGNKPEKSGNPLFADPEKATTLSPQVTETIGERLSAAGVSWAWYGGGWQAALDNPEGTVYKSPLSFQPHHQPFNYYQKYAPGSDARREHLLDGGVDGKGFIAAIDAGTLPQVAFYKPQGNLNQHAGYATVSDGDAHLAEVIAHLEKSPQWANMVVVITYDENGGWWDHVAPPKGDRWGPGTRIPAIIVSPFAKRGYVDHTQYDTGSIQRLINRRFGLKPLPGIEQRDEALRANGQKPMGDLTEALNLSK